VVVVVDVDYDPPHELRSLTTTAEHVPLCHKARPPTPDVAPTTSSRDLASEPNADAKNDVHAVGGSNANYSWIFQDVVDWVSCLVVTKFTNTWK